MSRRTMIAIAIVPACLVASVVFGARQGAAASGASSDGLIPAPTHWVPFSADFTMTRPRQPALSGRFFRASDGSTRRELTMSTDPPRTQITIVDVADHRHYVGHDLHWVAWPLQEGTPILPRIRADNPGYVKYQWRLALRRGENGSLKSDVGFDAYQFTGQPGHLMLLVPALNFFIVVMQQAGGMTMMYSNITIGEQPTSLFTLPAGAHVVFSNQPPGRRGPGEE
jgi:hypothetical protein